MRAWQPAAARPAATTTRAVGGGEGYFEIEIIALQLADAVLEGKSSHTQTQMEQAEGAAVAAQA